MDALTIKPKHYQQDARKSLTGQKGQVFGVPGNGAVKTVDLGQRLGPLKGSAKDAVISAFKKV